MRPVVRGAVTRRVVGGRWIEQSLEPRGRAPLLMSDDLLKRHVVGRRFGSVVPAGVDVAELAIVVPYRPRTARLTCCRCAGTSSPRLCFLVVRHGTLYLGTQPTQRACSPACWTVCADRHADRSPPVMFTPRAAASRTPLLAPGSYREACSLRFICAHAVTNVRRVGAHVARQYSASARR